MSAISRLAKEYNYITNNPNPLYSVKIVDDNLFEWIATIKGPPKTPYELGIFELNLKFSSDYPFKPPYVNFITKIYHPNINEYGEICVDILKLQNWSPVLNISSILMSIISLLDDPNVEDPLRTDAAKIYKNDREEYNNNVIDHVKKYANNNQ